MYIWYNIIHHESISSSLGGKIIKPSSLLNNVHDIRVSMPSVRLHIATKRPVGCWELDGTEELFQETLISLLIVLVHNLNQSVSYLVCSFQASNNLSGFPFDFIITLLL